MWKGLAPALLAEKPKRYSSCKTTCPQECVVSTPHRDPQPRAIEAERGAA